MNELPDDHAARSKSSRLVRWGRCVAFGVATICLVAGSVNGFFTSLQWVRARDLDASARIRLIAPETPLIQQSARLDLAAAVSNAEYSLQQLKFVVIPLAGGAILFFLMGCILHGLKLLLERGPTPSLPTDR
jgi:hypothetical protein